MRKLFILLFVLLSVKGYSQFPPNATNGTPTTMVLTRGVSGADSGYVFRTAFADTTALNRGLIDQLPGVMVRLADNSLVLRNNTATGWIFISGGSGSVTNLTNGLTLSGNTGKLGGTLIENTTVLMDGFNLVFGRSPSFKPLSLETDQTVIGAPGNSSRRWIIYNDSALYLGTDQSNSANDSVLVRDVNNRVKTRAQSQINGVNWYNTDGIFTGNRLAVNSGANGTVLIQNIGLNRNFTTSIKAAGVSTDSALARVRRSGGLNIAEMMEITGLESYAIRTGIHAIDLLYDSAGSTRMLLEVVRDSMRLNASGIAGEFSQAIVAPNSIYLKPNIGRLFVDTLNYTLATTGKKIMLRDTATGLVTNIDPSLIVAATPTWQQTLTAGSTLSTNNSILLGSTSFDFDRSGTEVLTLGTALTQISSPDATKNITLNNGVAGVTFNLGSDATGDVYYRSSGGLFTRLPVGSNGNVLTLAAGIPSWAAPSSSSAISSLTAATGTNSINNANHPQVWAWNTFDADGDNGLQLTANTTATIGAQGLFAVSVQGVNATSTITSAAATIQNIHTGTGSTNIGLDLSVSGGATANYGIRSNATTFYTHDGFWISGTNGGFLRSSGGTGQTEVGMAPGSGASTIYTTTDIYGQTGGAARWRTVAAGTYFGNSVASAHSQLQSGGSFAANYVEKTGTYTLDITDYTVNATSGTFTFTLPNSSGIGGRVYNLVNSGAGVITISTSGGQTFLNVALTPTTLTLSAVGSYTVQSTNGNWVVL